MQEVLESNKPVNLRRIKLGLRVLSERMAGLDFSLPDRMYDRGRGDGAMYYATPGKMLQRLFAAVGDGFDSFIDIGCGKGFTLCQAEKFGFARVAGIEYDDRLADTCERNMRKLRIGGRVSVFRGDAAAFEHYADYSVFYFFNPFQEDVMEAVISQIARQCRGREIVIIYYRPRYTGPIECRPYLNIQTRLQDDSNGYTANIYRGVIPPDGI